MKLTVPTKYEHTFLWKLFPLPSQFCDQAGKFSHKDYQEVQLVHTLTSDVTLRTLPEEDNCKHLSIRYHVSEKLKDKCWSPILFFMDHYSNPLLLVAQTRVATDLENLKNLEKSGNLKETPESQGICLNSQGICDRIPKVREFCCLKFIVSEIEDPNFENFLGEHAPRPP